jgi:hypothetical protein
VLVVLGQNTHQAYLAVGAVLGTFALVVTISGLPRFSTEGIDELTRRAGLLFVGAGTAAGGYLLLRGVPGILTQQPPPVWPERGTWFYWSYLADTYLLLPYLGVIGAGYLWLRHDDARVYVLGVILPFLVASLTPRKAPRFIVHLLPVLGVVVFVPIADGLRFTWQRITADAETVDRSELAMAATAPILILLVVAVPLAGLSVSAQPYDPPHQPPRSDWAAASDVVTEQADENAAIVSTRPELSLWYHGETEYFLRQRGLGAVARENGTHVHPRTGTVFLNETEDIRRLMSQEREIWLFAGKKFDERFTSSEARALVTAEFERRGDPSWTNMELYYYAG